MKTFNIKKNKHISPQLQTTPPKWKLKHSINLLLLVLLGLPFESQGSCWSLLNAPCVWQHLPTSSLEAPNVPSILLRACPESGRLIYKQTKSWSWQKFHKYTTQHIKTSCLLHNQSETKVFLEHNIKSQNLSCEDPPKMEKETAEATKWKEIRMRFFELTSLKRLIPRPSGPIGSFWLSNSDFSSNCCRCSCWEASVLFANLQVGNIFIQGVKNQSPATCQHSTKKQNNVHFSVFKI